MKSSEEITAQAEFPNRISHFKLHAFLQNEALTQRITSDLEQLDYAQILTSLAMQGSLENNDPLPPLNGLPFQPREQTLNASNAEQRNDFSPREKRRVKPSRKIREIQETDNEKPQLRFTTRHKRTAGVTEGSQGIAGDNEVRGNEFWRENRTKNNGKIVRKNRCPVKKDASSPNGIEQGRTRVKKNQRDSAGRLLRKSKKYPARKGSLRPINKMLRKQVNSAKTSGESLGMHDENENELDNEGNCSEKTEVQPRKSKEVYEGDSGSSDEKSPHKCEQCGKCFKTYYTFSIHIRMPEHTKETPFVCDICGKGFRLSSTLCRHKIIHTSNKPHECTVCRKTFNRSSTLKMHMRTHSARKQHVCATCGKGFHQKGNLRNHMFVHSGERPFCCETCGRHFNKKSNLKHHLKIHEMNGAFSCTICKKVFEEHAGLKEHMQDKHCHP